MNGTISTARVVRRVLAVSALAGAFLAASAGYGVDQAFAAYKANVQAGTLKIAGNAASDKLALRLKSGSPGTLQVDVGADGTADFSFDRSTFTAIDVQAGGGDDEVRVDQSAGSFPDEILTIDGGGGADTLVGGSGAETFLGSSGNDLVAGGDGSDRALLGGGDDRFTWNPGDDNDTVEGQAGSDLLDFNGSNIGESIDVSANGGRVRFTRNIANVLLDLGHVERVGYHAVGGADTIVVNDLAGTDTQTVDIDLALFGAGDAQPDTVVARGTEAADGVTVSSPAAGTVLVAGLSTRVQVTGSEAAHDEVGAATLGGDDTLTTGVGVTGPAAINHDGGEGNDTARFNGTADADQIDVFANGTEASVVAPANARLDVTAVESTVVLGLGGADTFGSAGNVSPLTTLTIDGGDDGDTLRGGNGADLLIGGPGNDVVDGNQGSDRALLGGGDDRFQWDPGDGNDTVEGQDGSDLLDFFGSNIGESIDVSANGSRVRFTRNIAAIDLDLDGLERVNFHAVGGPDTIAVNDLTGTGVETADIDLNASGGGGGDGHPDTVTVAGTSGPDHVGLASPGGYVIVSGLSAEVIVESAEAAHDDVNVTPLGGDDTITAGREVFGPASINVDGGEGADVTRYNGTDGADLIDVLANGAEVSTFAPLAARLDTTAVESLFVLGLDGEDTIGSVGNVAPLTTLTIDGGDANDVLRGGNGADLLLGGAGNDILDGNQGVDQALMGAGDDRFQWDPGDGNDTVEGQDGSDLLDFFGSSIGELIEVSANGERVRFTRNIANIVTDLNQVERIGYHASGGADTITVNDLTGTHAQTVELDLNILGGGGDAQPDTVVVNGTSGLDVVDVTRSGSEVLTTGLAAQTRIVGSEGANDTLRIQTLDGNDTVTVAPDVSDLIATVVDLGAGQ
jgi:Ca2+-binding RTX toxin-like protein